MEMAKVFVKFVKQDSFVLKDLLHRLYVQLVHLVPKLVQILVQYAKQVIIVF